jgi:hypothetical protein
MTVRLAVSLIILILTGCASAPERPTTLRQALFGLGERAAERIMAAPELPRPLTDQVLLLDDPEVDATFGISQERFLESLTRALLGITPGPQVLGWSSDMTSGTSDNQWRLDSHLMATGPALQLSDRRLLPYRLTLTLRRPGREEVLWDTEIEGAFDATAL